MTNKFTESKLEQAFIELLGNENFPHFLGNTLLARTPIRKSSNQEYFISIVNEIIENKSQKKDTFAPQSLQTLR